MVPTVSPTTLLLLVAMDWRAACIVPQYKGKGGKNECSNSRGISQLFVVGKLHGRVMLKRVIRAATECAIRVEQYVFCHCRECMDQAFAVRMCVKSILRMRMMYFERL